MAVDERSCPRATSHFAHLASSPGSSCREAPASPSTVAGQSLRLHEIRSGNLRLSPWNHWRFLAPARAGGKTSFMTSS
ncbi:hypothetical protein [Devosia sp. DBB001]|nr:hypothetical protein [Devosia sp. DBB001]